MTKYAANVVLIDFVVRSDMLGCPAHKRTSSQASPAPANASDAGGSPHGCGQRTNAILRFALR